MNDPRWLERRRIIRDLEDFLDRAANVDLGDSITRSMAEGLLMLLVEQHERDPDVPKEIR